MKRLKGRQLVISSFLLFVVFPICCNKTDNDSSIPQSYKFTNVSISEYSKSYFQDILNYSVESSPSVQKITKKANVGAVHNYPIRKSLLLASKTWGVKFYLKQKSIYICLPDESPPARYLSDDSMLVFIKHSSLVSISSILHCISFIFCIKCKATSTPAKLTPKSHISVLT